MTTNRVRLFGGAILTGVLVVGTAGLALAHNPTASPGTDWTGPGGSGMTNGSDTMDSQTIVGAMTGAMTGATMYASTTAGQHQAIGTMHASTTAGQHQAIGTMHASMATSGTFDPSGR